MTYVNKKHFFTYMLSFWLLISYTSIDSSLIYAEMGLVNEIFQVTMDVSVIVIYDQTPEEFAKNIITSMKTM